MEKIILFLSLAVLNLHAFSQCAIDQKELREKYCSGTYLFHTELSGISPSAEIALKEGNNYAIYLLNASHPVKEFCMADSHSAIMDLESSIYPDYSVYKFVPGVSDTYGFRIDFGTQEEACVLLAIYLQNENNLAPGFYRTFDELKYNNPSVGFNYRLIEKTRKYNMDQLITYHIEIDKSQSKKIGKVLGFSDGSRLFLNENTPSLKPGTEFVRAEFLDKFYYYEVPDLIVISNGSSIVTVPKIVPKLMDMNTGEIIVLNVRNLKEIISDNKLLLSEFETTTHKSKVLKEFLSRYFDEKYHE